MKRYFTSEAVTEGHPDKICDRISDKILDYALSHDKNCHMAVEATIKDELILIYGEAKCSVEITIVSTRTTLSSSYSTVT